MDGSFCIFLNLFVKDRGKYGIQINTPFKKWVNVVHNIVYNHSSNLYHLNTMADSCTFVQSVENPQHNVVVCNNFALAKIMRKIDAIHCSAEYI